MVGDGRRGRQAELQKQQGASCLAAEGAVLKQFKGVVRTGTRGAVRQRKARGSGLKDRHPQRENHTIAAMLAAAKDQGIRFPDLQKNCNFQEL